MARELSGLSDYLVASPQNLHLSHLMDSPLLQLESNPEIPTAEIAHSIAEQSFERLSTFLQTMVTVAVYDLKEIRSEVGQLAQTYRAYLEEIQQNSLFVDNVDCRSIPGLHRKLPRDGVTLYFQPPAFGTESASANHSGWGCKQ